jgi:porphyrinogen peroxidase
VNHQVSKAQTGLLTEPNSFADFLTFVLLESLPGDVFRTIAESAASTQRSVGSQDPTAQLTLTIGVSHNGWNRLLPDQEMPRDLAPFEAMSDGDRTFPSTAGDLFCMIKSERLDLSFLAAKELKLALVGVAELIEDIPAFGYLDSRDLIGFVDGTENPVDEERAEAVLVGDEQPALAGGSYVTVQRYMHRAEKWEAESVHEQERVIGRTKSDDIEMDADAKPASAHSAKSNVKVDGEEIKMYRQNRAFGNALAYGTMFVGFARSSETLTTSLRQMIEADQNGDYDRLLDYVDAETGTNYFVPPQTLLDESTR